MYINIKVTADGVTSSCIIGSATATWPVLLALVQEEIDAELGTITKIVIEPTEM